jgi:glucokinase
MEDDFVLAVDVGGTKTALAAVTRRGTVEAREMIPTLASDGAKSLVRRVVEGGEELVSRVRGTLRGIGAVSPGVVRDDRVLLSPNVPGLERTSLVQELRDGFGIGAAGIGNDVKAAALAEARWGELQGSPCGIFLNLGTGLAVSVVIDGTVLDGAHGAAGELGYQLRGVADLPHAAQDLSGGEGAAPLEEYVSGKALSVRGSALLGHEASTAEVFAAAQLKPELARLVEDALDTLAVHVANLAVVLDPDRIVAGGGMLAGEGGERILRRVQDVLTRVVPFPGEVRRGRFVQDAPLLGAALLAWDAVDAIG